MVRRGKPTLFTTSVLNPLPSFTSYSASQLIDIFLDLEFMDYFFIFGVLKLKLSSVSLALTCFIHP